MNTVTSQDGTAIAFDRIGEGPALILVDGALCYRASGPNGPLAALLAEHFTVFTYDRRGRGESGDNSAAGAYSAEREVEDLQALFAEAGGSAYLYGISSGAALALEATNRGLPVKKLALYEAPFIVDNTRAALSPDYLLQLERLVATDRRGDSVKHFMRKGVGLPALVVAMMRLMPAWPKLKGVAHTLPYDVRLVDAYQHGTPLPAAQWSSATAPTLVIDGGKSPKWMRNGTKSLADVLPQARYETLPGQTHLVKPPALAPVLTRFFTDHG
ncbi:MAG: hydrolase [Amycolatopsis sp.]|jgi:pimeloyl-ACP methyl ester carboxylesterase|uniref:alpha/beta fold hydrolase n=1 Tax=Amycolatopsis sp. TaxID=37632 RepID=UPI0026362EBB|nr:alpha/beta hydrolase [Amycolatopsis sp.]MCU1685898.1 hydrolase [Amycolatopsis sp.]